MRSFFFFLTLFIFAFPAVSYADLININTADATLLDTLPGIGPSKATAIVDYRTQNGPFARIEDIQNVSGIGPSTYAGLAPFITVGTSVAAPVPTATTTASSSGSASTYTPPPLSLTVEMSSSGAAVLNVPLHLSARVTTKGSVPDANARIMWSFGDGSSGEGTSIDKTYRYAGTYLITVDAMDGSALGHDEMMVTVTAAQVRISTISGDGITLQNDASERLDLSDWRLHAGFATFRIPHGTMLLPHASVLFPSLITNLPTTFDSALLYPDGRTAYQYVLPEAQPTTQETSSNEVQTTPVSTEALSTTAYGITSGQAPTGTAYTASVGANQPVVAAVSAVAAVAAATLPEEATSTPKQTGFLRSPWTLGLLGVIVVASGAFIFI